MAKAFRFSNNVYDLKQVRQTYGPGQFAAVVPDDATWSHVLEDWEIITGERSPLDWQMKSVSDRRKCVVCSVIYFSGASWVPKERASWDRVVDIIFWNNATGNSQCYPWTVLRRSDKPQPYYVLLGLMLDPELKYTPVDGVNKERIFTATTRSSSLAGFVVE